MKNKSKISIVAIVAILSLGTALMTISSSESIELQSSDVRTVVKGSVPDFTIEELSKGTSHAIIGEVKSITPVIVERENRKYVFSDVVLSVEQDLFNEYSEKEISVRITGGQVGDIVTKSHIDASFDINERVFVFVAGPEPDSIFKDNYYVAGLTNGKYNLSDGKAIRGDSAHSHGSHEELVTENFFSTIQTYRGN